jgi:hypothetical protein
MSWLLERVERSSLRHPGLAQAVIEALALRQIDRIIAYAHRASAQRRDREGRIECKPSLDRSLRFINSTQMRKGRGRPKFIAADYERLTAEPVRVAHRPFQRISAQSPPRFDTTIFRRGQPYSPDTGPFPQVPLYALRLRGAEQTLCESFLPPAGISPQQHRRLGQGRSK